MVNETFGHGVLAQGRATEDGERIPGAAHSGALGGGELRVSEIYVGDSESLEAALRRFNKRVQADGILTDARRHEYYEKPSERRKKKEAARRRKLRKAIARQKTRETA